MTQEGIHPSHQPDVTWLDRLAVVESACLQAVVIVTLVILCAWWVPAVGEWLPGGWELMQVNTALCLLLYAISLVLTQYHREDRNLLASRAYALLALFFAGAALLEHVTGRAFTVNRWLVVVPSEAGGLMSLQTATFLALFGLALLFGRPHLGMPAWIMDALTLGLIVIVLTVFSGYCFDAANLFGQSPYVRTAPQTLTCMALLTLVQAIHRTRHGLFSLFVGIGIGSRIARLALPLVVVLPFLLVGAANYAFQEAWVSDRYATAMSAASTVMLWFVLLVLLARKINELERGLRTLSLNDDLTRLYNRRGLFMLGEYALRQSQRAKAPLSVLFFDLDGLKAINDTQGHNAGSQLIAEFGHLLNDTFRRSDIAARLGGDEFAVVAYGDLGELAPVLARLETAVADANAMPDKSYQISYSVGGVTNDPDREQSFESLIHDADVVMYENKRRKKQSRAVQDALPV